MSTPVQLIAFVAALVLIGDMLRVVTRRRAIALVPERERGKLLDEEATRYGVDGRHLSSEQVLDIIRRSQRQRFLRDLSWLLLALGVVIIIANPFGHHAEPKPDAAPPRTIETAVLNSED